MSNIDCDVILASLKLARAMRRCPPERQEMPFPPAVGRLLACAAENPADGLLTRAVDEADRRIQRITLSEKGRRIITDMESARDLDARKKTSCLTEEEKRQFCELCNRLSEHIERLALDLPEDRRMPPHHPGPGFPPPGPGPRHCPPGPEEDRPADPGFPPRGPRIKC